MAALPVSPLVAPSTVSGPSDGVRRRKYSNRLPKNCSATSLNAAGRTQ